MAFDYEQFFEHSIDMLCIAGEDGYLKRVNPSFERILGWSTRELMDTPFIEFIHFDDVAATVEEIERLAGGEVTMGFENRWHCRDGGYRHLRWTAMPDPSSGLVFAIAHDITADVETTGALEAKIDDLSRRLEQARGRLEQLSITDPLTGTRTRRAFEDTLQMIGRMASRSGGWLSLVMLDIDHLKEHNDNFGHRAGDEILRMLGALLLDTARRSDVVARYGEEEFVIILPDTSASGAMHFAERLAERVRRHDWEYRQVTVSVGVGSVEFVAGETTRLKWNLGKIVSDAQRALQLSKQKGTGIVTHATGVERQLAARGS